MMDLSSEILETAQSLIQKANLLPKVGYEWQTPIVFNLKSIIQQPKGIDETPLKIISSLRHLPALYYFRMPNCVDAEAVVHKLRTFKELKTHSCPLIDSRGYQSDILYCGSVRNNLHGRLIQHLGKGHRLTYSLQLAHWASEMDLDIEFHYALLEAKYVDYTELLESALTRRLKPLVGKAV